MEGLPPDWESALQIRWLGPPPLQHGPVGIQGYRARVVLQFWLTTSLLCLFNLIQDFDVV